MTELLAPVGSKAALDAALRFGADAVYLGGPMLQLRAKSAGFSFDAIADAAKKVHVQNRRLYVTVNSLAYGDEIDALPAYANQLKDCGADAAIVSDLGVLTAMHIWQNVHGVGEMTGLRVIFGNIFQTLIGVNGVIELVAAVILVPALYKAVSKVMKQQA